MKRNKNISPVLKRIVKHSYLLLLIPVFASNAEDRPGLLLNGAISAQYNDNVLNNVSEISDTAIVVEPEVKYFGLVGKHKFILSYDGKFANYTKDSDLSFNEHKLAASALLDHSHKLSSEFKLNFDKKIETPGSTNSSTQSLEDFNKLENKSAIAKLYYGQKSSIGQIVLGYKYSERTYTNNQQSFRDVGKSQFDATFFYRVAPKTRVIFYASTEDFKYKDQLLANGISFNQSSTNNLYLAGIEWEATAKSTGTFRLGYQNKDYDDERLNDISGLSYMLDLVWKPNPNTQIKLGADRQSTESAQINEGGFLSTSYSIELSHELTARTQLKAKIMKDNDDIVFSSGSANRTDKRNTLELGANHSLRDWIDINLSYKYQEKTSDIDAFNYKSNIINLSLETTF
ncbi:outer membrane beta-barrel protein [Pseudocolwellia sp. AS88]|uniref:outer membrane beta-barrel protein n=1 Tax=Pseudocolwellia sp. AS88 TaxID=3063958 RepID=UPI0026F07378|nr:outer membrane beta-barrel protein [Pseudocolwellia sp. AS88]MDO7086811.1 outer membrane beta-barrel protein [Pseudocolwellia sp. AS88]